MKQQYSKESFLCSSHQSGFALVTFIATFFAFLTIIGISVDIGNLYRAKLRLQRAVDAAAIGGTYLVGAQNDTAIVQAAQKIASSNVGAGLFLSAPVFNVTSASGVMQIQGHAQVPLLILKLVPGFTSPIVTASATSTTSRLIVSLVMDTSGSMNCPASGTCPNNCYADNSCVRPTKLDKLKEAAVSFVNLFDESMDQIALVGFDTRTSNHYSIYKAITTPFNKTLLTQTIIPSINANTVDSHGVSTTGGTDIQAGLREGRNQLSLANQFAGAKKSLVLISDGAPNSSDDSTNVCNGINGREKHFIRAIAEADLARQGGAAIYSIGLGSPDSVITDAYQSTDETLLKKFLLRRISNATSTVSNPTGSNDFDCVASYQQYNTGSAKAVGDYLETPNATQLQPLLVRVGKSIKAMLTH